MTYDCATYDRDPADTTIKWTAYITWVEQDEQGKDYAYSEEFDLVAPDSPSAHAEAVRIANRDYDGGWDSVEVVEGQRMVRVGAAWVMV